MDMRHTCDVYDYVDELMSEEVITTKQLDRASLVNRGRYLEYFTIGYNSLEGWLGAS
jgi:hypothetical protein